MRVVWIALEGGLLIVGIAFVLAAVLPGASTLFGRETPDAKRTKRRVGAACAGLALVAVAAVIRGAIVNAPTHTEPAIAARPGKAPDLAEIATVALYSCHAPPDPPAPPDGASASKEQMIASNRETSKYNTDMNQYLDCLKTTSANVQAQYRGSATVGEVNEVDALAVRLNNEAVDRLQSKVKIFNGELAKYKARSAP